MEGDTRGLPPTKVKWLGSSRGGNVATPTSPCSKDEFGAGTGSGVTLEGPIVKMAVVSDFSADPGSGASVATGFGISPRISEAFFLGFGAGMGLWGTAGETGLGVATLGLKVDTRSTLFCTCWV